MTESDPAITRSMALQDARQHVRQAASAVAAASRDEPDPHRRNALSVAHSQLADLKELLEGAQR